MSASRFRWLAILLIGGSCVAGYAIGKASWNPVVRVQEPAAVPSTRAVRTSVREKRMSEDPWQQFTALLTHASRESDIWNIVSQLPADRIPDALRDLRTAQYQAPTGSGEAERLAEIESALYFHWAETDPQAALADVSTMPGEPDQKARSRRTVLLKSVLAAWMRVDANGAYRAVKDHKDFGYTGRDMLVATWTPKNVFQNANLYPDKHGDLLGWYCVAAAENHTKRNAMLTPSRNSRG